MKERTLQNSAVRVGTPSRVPILPHPAVSAEVVAGARVKKEKRVQMMRKTNQKIRIRYLPTFHTSG